MSSGHRCARWVGLCLAAFSVGGLADYRAGVEAYRVGDHERALREWRQVAEQPPGTGDPAVVAEASYALGMLYWLGQGAEQSSTLSARWLAQAADSGHAGAQSKLGYLYLIGQGVPQSDFEALKWLRMAAHQGNADAQYNLGVMYRDGRGVAASPERALEWFSEAAAKGDSMSVAVIAEYQRTGVLRASMEPSLTQPEAGLAAVPAPAPAADPGDAAALAPSAEPDRDTEPRPSPAEKVATFKTSELQGKPDRAPERDRRGTGSGDVEWPAGVMREDWIAERDPGHYTIQVIAVRQVEGVQDFIAEHPELAPFAVYRQGSPGVPLWVLIQGDYATLEEARGGWQRFPTVIQPRDKLWIRPFRDVHGLLP